MERRCGVRSRRAILSNTFIGVPCGIMDRWLIGHWKRARYGAGRFDYPGLFPIRCSACAGMVSVVVIHQVSPGPFRRRYRRPARPIALKLPRGNLAWIYLLRRQAWLVYRRPRMESCVNRSPTCTSEGYHGSGICHRKRCAQVTPPFQIR